MFNLAHINNHLDSSCCSATMNTIDDIVESHDQMTHAASPDCYHHQIKLELHQVEALPRDVLFCITDCLSEAELVCLSLVNQQWKNILSGSVWHKTIDRSLRQDFLHLYGRDLPKYIVCHVCARLHLHTNLQWPCNVQPERWPCGIVNRIATLSLHTGFNSHTALAFSWHSRFNINFGHVQAVMKASKFGDEIGLPLRALRHLEINEIRRPLTVINPRLISVDPLVADNRLLVRSQTIFGNHSVLGSPATPWAIRPWAMSYLRRTRPAEELCLHLGETTPPHSSLHNPYMSDIGSLIDFKIRNPVLPDRSCRTTSTCSRCYMDYCIDCVYLEKYDTAVFVVTKWQDLGRGLSCNDKAWMCHVDQRASLFFS